MSHRIETEAITERELSLVSLSLLYHFFCFEPQKALINNMLNSDILNLWHSKWYMDIHETNTFLQNQDALERLQADHLALFVGIGMPKAVPWGSVYLTEENLLLQRSTHALTAFLKSHRIILCTDEQQISDHIGLCLSVLALLLKQWGDYPEETTERTIREFLRDHLLPWSGRFCELLTAHAETPLYALLGKVTKRILKDQQHQWQITPRPRTLYY